ncbi:MAG: hypothetical protein ACP5NS_00205 [Candidatus Pacearchaeota archaeon]
MNTKRAIWIAVALYFVTLIAGIIITLIAKAILSSPQEIPTTYWIITIVLTVLLTSLASIWYFNKSGTIRNIKEGLKIGFTFVVISLILSLLLEILISIITKTEIQLSIISFKDIASYIPFLLVIASAIYVGSRNPTKENNLESKKKKK